MAKMTSQIYLIMKKYQLVDNDLKNIVVTCLNLLSGGDIAYKIIIMLK